MPARASVPQQTVTRSLGQKIKAGWRKIGALGNGKLGVAAQAATVAVVGGAAAFGMNQLGISPAETGMVLTSAAAVGTGTLAVMAHRARGLWNKSLAALKMKRVDEASARKDIPALENTIGELKSAVGKPSGKDAKAQARDKAYLSFALARAELALDDASDPKQRLTGATAASWKDELGKLDSAAAAKVTKTSEGRLALRLRDVGAEIKAEQGVLARHQQAVSRFDDFRPVVFGGGMKKQAKTAQQLVSRLKNDEIGGEQKIEGKVESAMRGRVSNRLAGERSDFKSQLNRQASLQTLHQGAIKQALDRATRIDQSLSSAMDERDQADTQRSLAPLHVRDAQPVYDNAGRQTGTTYVDNSASYYAQAALHESEADRYERNASSAMSELSGQLKALQKNPAMISEKLTAPSASLPQVSSYDLRRARDGLASTRNALSALDRELGKREQAGGAWIDKQIDSDLTRQMAAAR